MNRQNQIKYWYIRYHMIFGKRYSRKQKDRFLKSLTADILQYRQDLKLDIFKLNKKSKTEYRNLYVGDPKNANTIICTYYDTPAVRFSSYHFFNKKRGMKGTINFILLSSFIYIILGLIFTSLVAVPIFQSYGINSMKFLLCILFYIVYFYYLNKLTKGWPKKNNLVQNTSSILLLLNCIASMQKKGVVFAFLDAGYTNNIGLKRLMNKSNAKFYILDSIGSDQPLYKVNGETNQSKLINTDDLDTVVNDNENYVYLISGEKKNHEFVLSWNDLQKKDLNDRNMNEAFLFLERVVRGEKT